MRRVDPSVYTKEYYLKGCSGYEEFKRSAGRILEPRLKRIVREIPVKKGMRILDIGCGRGELVFWAARRGAIEAIGIDYSENAIGLANAATKKKNKAAQNKITFRVMDAKKLRFPKQRFDAVFLVEVLEHLYIEEQDLVFKEISRVLKKQGFVFIHTAPSRWFNDYTYRLWCYPVSTIVVSISNLLTGKKHGNLAPWKKLRQKYHKLMHVNEPDYFSLKKLFTRHGFVGSIKSTNITILKPAISWKDKLFNAVVYLYPLSRYAPFNIFWGNDFVALLRKKN